MAEHKDKKSFLEEGIPEYDQDVMHSGLHGIKEGAAKKKHKKDNAKHINPKK